MAHSETIKKVGSVEMVEGDDEVWYAHIEVVTSGNVRKVIRIPHVYASGLKLGIECGIGLMEPEDRKRSWLACVAWIKRGWK
ncbi:hypothetical protein ACFTXM_09645 [Streptomyces sp. NPDC056930]|uniref:hypothetical protein n=1 Tax=Streptomyces sp. NPDC056930 TaxID=3345967 RepID=UPI003644B817